MNGAAVTSSARHGPPRRILYVDDDDTAARSVERLLAHLGHEVHGLRDPRAAVAHFAAAPDRWDLVITDFKMPELDGLGVARAILAARPGQPMMLLSGFAESRDLELARAAGLQVFLSKPVSLDDLAAAIHRAIHPPGSPPP